MPPVFVLVHSPSVGRLTWAPVADRLEARGQESIVPSLLDVADAAAPFWPRAVEDVTAAMRRFDRPSSECLHSCRRGNVQPRLVVWPGLFFAVGETGQAACPSGRDARDRPHLEVWHFPQRCIGVTSPSPGKRRN